MLHRISVPLIVLTLLTGTAFALDVEKLQPKTEDIERATKYERLKGRTDLNRIHGALSKSVEHEPAANISCQQAERQKYLFFLFSKSVPDSAIESVFVQAQKLQGYQFLWSFTGSRCEA